MTCSVCGGNMFPDTYDAALGCFTCLMCGRSEYDGSYEARVRARAEQVKSELALYDKNHRRLPPVGHRGGRYKGSKGGGTGA